MNRNLSLTLCSLVAFTAQGQDVVVKRSEVSVHSVERGSMSVFAPASGTLTSLRPGRAVLTFDNDQGKCETGRGARLVVGENPKPLAGKVVRRADAGNCEVEFTDVLPEGAVTSRKVGGLIVTDELKDVVFLGRPATSKPHSTATIFLLESASQARRVTVRYGAMSGPLIQVLDGLAPGDRVIVTDLPKLADFQRIRLE